MLALAQQPQIQSERVWVCGPRTGETRCQGRIPSLRQAVSNFDQPESEGSQARVRTEAWAGKEDLNPLPERLGAESCHPLGYLTFLPWGSGSLEGTHSPHFLGTWSHSPSGSERMVTFPLALEPTSLQKELPMDFTLGKNG